MDGDIIQEEVFISIYNRWCVSPLGPGNSWCEIIHVMLFYCNRKELKIDPFVLFFLIAL
jgi:hypothetical protein